MGLSKDVDSYLIELKELIDQAEGSSVGFFFILRNNRDKSLSLRLATIKEDIGKRLIDIVKTWIDKIKEGEANLADYDPSNAPSNEVVQYMETPDEVKTLISYSKKAGIPIIKDNELKQSCWGFMVKIEGKNNKVVYAFGKTTKGILGLKKGRLHLALHSNGELELIKDSPVISFPEKVDVIVYGDKALLIDAPKFENLFDFKEKMVQTIQGKKGVLHGFVDDPDKLVELATKNMMTTRKIYGILLKFNPNRFLKQEVQNWVQKKRLNIKLDQNGRMIVEETNLREVLKVLNENYGQGAFTRTEYEVFSKKPI